MVGANGDFLAPKLRPPMWHSVDEANQFPFVGTLGPFEDRGFVYDSETQDEGVSTCFDWDMLKLICCQRRTRKIVVERVEGFINA
jgi:hypothetical protein